MKIEHQISLIDEILNDWHEELGDSFDGYRNHVYRMVNFTYALADLGPDERDKVAVAGAFHDIGIWPGDNFDYLCPSIDRSRNYLDAACLNRWSDDVARMISEHHKLRRVTGDRLVEAFRRGDLVDFSLGILGQGLPRTFIREVKDAFPNAGFHRSLIRTACRWIVRHPLRPVPVVKW